MNNEAHIRILSVDDHPLLNEGIAALICYQLDMQLVAQATSGSDAIVKFRGHRPDVTLMDLRLPDKSGIDTMIAIRTEFPEARIIMLTTFEGDVEIQRALGAGAHGYVLKSMPPQDLVATIRQVHAGKKGIPSEVRLDGRTKSRMSLCQYLISQTAIDECFDHLLCIKVVREPGVNPARLVKLP